MKNKNTKRAFVACILGITAIVVLTFGYAIPLQGPFAKYNINAVEIAGTNIDTTNAPIWRLCALPGVGEKTAQQIRQQQNKAPNKS